VHLSLKHGVDDVFSGHDVDATHKRTRNALKLKPRAPPIYVCKAIVFHS